MTELLETHWAWCAMAAVLSLVGEVVKKRLLRPEILDTSPVAQWLPRTLPLHPVAVGGLLGLTGALPCPEHIGSDIGEALYFAFAGVASTFLYDIARTWSKRHGYGDLPC